MSEWLYGAAAVCLLAGLGAWVAHVYSLRAADAARVALRFRGMTEGSLPGLRRKRLTYVPVLRIVRERMLLAGIQPAAWHGVLLAALVAGSLAVGGLRSGSGGALLTGTAPLWIGWLVLLVRCERRRAQTLEQLPGFLDHVSRAVQTGSSVHTALILATGEAKAPLKDVFERVNRQVDCGAHLEDALDEPHVLMDLRELRVFALSVRVNQRFGGSIRDLLHSVVRTIRARDRARREFRALTGETRLSAWILGLVPLLIALYLCAVNPTFLGRMAADPAGRVLLALAVGLQALGSLLLWRMVRSV